MTAKPSISSGSLIAAATRKQERQGNATPRADGVQDYDPETIERSPFNRTIALDDPETISLIKRVKKNGVLQNGIIRPVPFDPAKPKIRWQLIAGERRWIAATAAGKDFPATIRDVGDIEAMELQGEENFERKNLNPMEQARTFQQLRDAYIAGGMTKTEAMARLEGRLGKKEAIIYERLTLLELPEKTRELVSAGRLPASHAALLPKIHDPKTIDALAVTIANKSGEAPMSFRESQRLVDDAVAKEKQLAEWQRLRGEYGEKGWKVLGDAENKKVFPWASGMVDSDSGYIEGEKERSFATGYKSWIKAMGKHAPSPVLARAPSCKPVIVYPLTAALAAVQANEPRKKAGGASGAISDEKVKAAKKRARAKLRRTAFNQILTELVSAVERAGDSETFLLAIARRLISNITSSGERSKHVVERRGLFEDTSKAATTILDHQVNECFNAKQLRGIIIEAIAWQWAPYDFGAETSWQNSLVEFCGLWGVDPTKIEEQVHSSGNGSALPVKPAKMKPKGLTAAGRARLAAAMKAKWAKRKKGK